MFVTHYNNAVTPITLKETDTSLKSSSPHFGIQKDAWGGTDIYGGFYGNIIPVPLEDAGIQTIPGSNYGGGTAPFYGYPYNYGISSPQSVAAGEPAQSGNMGSFWATPTFPTTSNVIGQAGTSTGNAYPQDFLSFPSNNNIIGQAGTSTGNAYHQDFLSFPSNNNIIGQAGTSTGNAYPQDFLSFPSNNNIIGQAGTSTGNAYPQDFLSFPSNNNIIGQAGTSTGNA